MPSTTSTVTRRPRWRPGRWSRRPPPYDEHVRRRDERVEAHVVVLSPRPRLAGQLVVDFVGLPRLEPDRGHVDLHRRLADGVRVQVDDDEHAVVTVLLGPGQDLLVVRAVPAQVAQLPERGVRVADPVEPGDERSEASPLLLRLGPVAGTVGVLLAVEVL